ncbi:hypothetical protein [Leptospira borgpetersenii]|uniref:hypothetical protein n=1 Tax=Leptospira borgpetersenii TaxID=174 RepID=UPI000774B429|nr:hypothetical protein [Leptospira borgpetersenii]
MAIPEFSYHCLEYRSFTPRMLNSHAQRKISGYFLFHLFSRIQSFFFTARPKNPVYFVRKIKLQGSVPVLGQVLIKFYVSNLQCFLKKSTSEFSGKK